MNRHVSKLLTAIFLASFLLVGPLVDSALACLGPHQRLFPICEISAPRTNQRTVIYANSGKGLSSAALGSDAIVTEVVDIEVGLADKPHYIVLSSGKPIIWRFNGRIDSISRVIVFGSQYAGATKAGVIGVPKDRVIFTKPDIDKLRAINRHSCLSIYIACEASAYFEIPKADRMQLAGDEPRRRHRVDQFVEHLRAGVIRIPEDGWVEAEARGRWQTSNGQTAMTGPGLGRYEPYGGFDYIETSQSYERGVIKIDPASVISQEQVKDYKVLPAVAGLRQLLSQGAIADREDPQYKAAYQKWNTQISQPYRSKLDPDFLFSYRVDYLVTKPITLPAAVEKKTFLVAEGVDTPDMSSNYKACLYFADRRTLNVDRGKERDPRCNSSLVSLARSEAENKMGTALFSLGEVQRANQTDKDKCSSFKVAPDTWFAGVALSEGDAWRPAATDTSRRRIDIIVKRPGKVAIYLDVWGGRTDWHIAPSPQTQITNVVIWEVPTGVVPWHQVHGLDASIPIQRVPAKNSAEGCYRFIPTSYAYLGGPAVQALDQQLHVRAGRRLDVLLRQTNDGTWPPVSADPNSAILTLVIE